MSKNTEALIINTPEDGFLRIGNTTEDRKLRPDQVQLGAGCGSSLRIFEDGGWELRSQPNNKGCNLIAKGDGGQTATPICGGRALRCFFLLYYHSSLIIYQ